MDNPFRIFFAGDFCSTPSTKPIEVSKELKGIISSCDFRVCNFEVPLKPDGVEQQKGRYYQHDDAPSFLEELGFNQFSFANNHAFDYGMEGWQKTMNAFHTQPFGSGTYKEAYSVKVIEKDGVKVGFLALCFAARFGVFDDVCERDGYGCAYINDLKVNHVIMDAKKKVDFLIILPHDGIEYVDIPLPETIARYRDFIDYGADAVIGTHPHCPQGWEEYKGKPIFYSLGNFLFNSKQDYSYRVCNRPHWYEGLCVLLELDAQNRSILYRVINTQNVDNLGIIVDKEPQRNTHNEKLCYYLTDRVEYGRCFQQQMRKIVLTDDLPKLDTTFHDVTWKKSLKAIIKYILNIILRKQNKSDFAVQRMLKHDAQRAGLLRVLKYYNSRFVNERLR